MSIVRVSVASHTPSAFSSLPLSLSPFLTISHSTALQGRSKGKAVGRAYYNGGCIISDRGTACKARRNFFMKTYPLFKATRHMTILFIALKEVWSHTRAIAMRTYTYNYVVPCSIKLLVCGHLRLCIDESMTIAQLFAPAHQ